MQDFTQLCTAWPQAYEIPQHPLQLLDVCLNLALTFSHSTRAIKSCVNGPQDGL